MPSQGYPIGSQTTRKTQRGRVVPNLKSPWLPAAAYIGAWFLSAVAVFGPGTLDVAKDLLVDLAWVAVPVLLGCWLSEQLGTEPLAVIEAARKHQSISRALITLLALSTLAAPIDFGVTLLTLRFSKYLDAIFKTDLHRQITPFHAPGMSQLPFFTEFFLSTSLSEEALYRLGLLTLLIYVSSLTVARPRVKDPPTQMPPGRSTDIPNRERIWQEPTFWVANLLQALVFGAVHRVIRGRRVDLLTVLENPPTWSGVIYGFLYWRFGIEVAVLTHAFSNLIILFVWARL